MVSLPLPPGSSAVYVRELGSDSLDDNDPSPDFFLLAEYPPVNIPYGQAFEKEVWTGSLEEAQEPPPQDGMYVIIGSWRLFEHL